MGQIRAARVGSTTGRGPRLTRLVHFWFTRGVKLALLGGGGFRTPAIYRALAEGSTRTTYDGLVLYDVDQARLDRIAAVLSGIDERLGRSVPITTTTDLDEAVDGADVVYCAVRVGGLAGRLLDETAALAEGVIGQETTGAGGITFALRTVPVVTEIAEVVARRAPRAMFINFTNPVGLVTEAIRRVLGDRVIGICDAPLALCRRVAAALDREPEDLWFDYFGINHLGWLRAVLDHGRDLLPGPPGRRAAPARLRGGPAVRRGLAALGRDDPERVPLLLRLRERGARPGCRQAASGRNSCRGSRMPSIAAPALPPTRSASGRSAWRSAREATWRRPGRAVTRSCAGVAAARETGGYGRLSLDLVDAMNGDGHEVMILNVANRSSLPFLDEAAVVEVPCIVGRGGVVPVAIGSVPMAAGGPDRRGPGGRARGDRGGLLPFPPARGPRPGPPSPRALRGGREPDPRPPPQGAARARGDAPMTVDVVCAGPPFLDLVFRGLSRLPEPGEEVLAEELAIVPGAMANVAFALRQLGVDAVVCSPVGTDPAGRLLQALMAEAGIPWLGRQTPTTPVSVALPIDGERAFVTHFPAPDVDVAAIAAAEPRAVVLNLPLAAGLVPAFPPRHA